MSRERFDWLERVAGEVIPTPGCESNVKEIFDKCRELRKSRKDIFIFNQFEEFGNHLWHYEVTGKAMGEVLKDTLLDRGRYAGFVSQTGSAGTIGAGDYLKEIFPGGKIAAGEALQCPTLLRCGYGGHRIEGIGDKHVPWIHNVRNTDIVIAVDDMACMNLMRLFNEPAGQQFLCRQGVEENIVRNLHLLGLSSIGNLLCAVKFAKYYELTDRDVVLTVWTDSMALYHTRVREMEEAHGRYSAAKAERDYHRYLLGESTANMRELGYYDKKQIHNLKYFTWIEQQSKELAELNAQWYDYPDYWARIHGQAGEIDRLIGQFNERVASA
jgi:cysteine synthase A